MMYRYIDEYNIEEWNKKYVIIGDKQISYPSEEDLLQAGLKPLVDGDDCENIEYDPDTQTIIEYYENTDSRIIRHYQVMNILLSEEEVVYE